MGVGSVIILLLLIFLGIPALMQLSLVMQQKKDKQQPIKNVNSAFIPPPSLDMLPTATNSAVTNITGSISGEYLIRLYNNDTFIQETNSKKDGSFIFRNVKLQEGENVIRAIARDEEKQESSGSNVVTVSYSNKKPQLVINFPLDNQEFKNTNNITVTGQSDNNARVMVNGFWTISDNKGGFSYNLSLKNGDNQIIVTATDEAGNQKEIKLKVSYNP